MSLVLFLRISFQFDLGQDRAFTVFIDGVLAELESGCIIHLQLLGIHRSGHQLLVLLNNLFLRVVLQQPLQLIWGLRDALGVVHFVIDLLDGGIVRPLSVCIVRVVVIARPIALIQPIFECRFGPNLLVDFDRR